MYNNYTKLFFLSFFFTVLEPQSTGGGDWEHRLTSGAQLCWDPVDWWRDWSHLPWGCPEKGQRTGTCRALWKLGGGECWWRLQSLLINKDHLLLFCCLVAHPTLGGWHGTQVKAQRVTWSNNRMCPLPLFDSAVRILEYQVSQERVLCNRTVWRNGALQQHCVQLTGSATCSSSASAILHFPLLHFYHGGHSDWEGHYQPPSAQ